MIISKQDILKIGIGILIGGGILFFLMKDEVEYVDVPVTIEIETPVIVKETDTIYMPTPVHVAGPVEIDSTYYEEYVKLKDSVAKNEAYKDAITIRTYNEKIEDDTLKIDLYTKIRGTLLEYQVGYKVKPQTYSIDTVLTVPVPRKTRFYVGGEFALPKDIYNYKPTIIPGAIMQNKKATKLYKLSYDPINNVVQGGLYFRL